MPKLEDFEARFSNPDLTIPFSFDNERQQRIENNTEILKMGSRSYCNLWQTIPSAKSTSRKDT